MVDDSSIDLGQQANDANTLSDSMTNLGNVVSKILPSLKNLYDTLTGVFGTDSRNNMDLYKNKLSDVSTVFTDISKKIDDLEDDTTSLVDASGRLVQPIDNLLISFGKVGAFMSTTNFFDKMKTDGNLAINSISENVSGLTAKFKDMGLDISKIGIAGTLATTLLQNASQAERLETEFTGLAAKAGNLNDMFEADGKTLKDLSTITTEYTNMTLEAAQATGLSAHQSLDYANALKAIPDVLRQNIDNGSDLNNDTSTLQKTMQLMSGTTGNYTDVVNSLTTAYNYLSDSGDKVSSSGEKVATTAQKGAEFLALTSQVANTLRLRFDDVKGVMESVAQGFQFIGNETDATGRILARYTDALRETGLTGKASLGVIQEMIGGIEKMTIGTKAFLSLRSGGPGGLQGGFQIEQLLRQGRLDEVTRMAERALRQQFGGRIYTQAEAAQSPEAAAQFMRQRQLLRSGAFGIGQNLNDAQATRFLEALRTGRTGEATNVIKSGQDALKQATDRGTAIETRNNNELKQLNTQMERAVIASEIQAGIMIRNAIGTGGALGGRLQEDMRRAGGRGAEAQGRLNVAGRGGEVERNIAIADLLKGSVGAFSSAARLLSGGLGGMVRGAKDEIATFNESARKVLQGDTAPTTTQEHRQTILQSAFRAHTGRTNTAIGDVVHSAANVRPTSAVRKEPQKMVLEIVAPAGFGVRKTANSIQKANVNSTVINFDIDHDPGY